MESQHQNPEIRINPGNFHLCVYQFEMSYNKKTLYLSSQTHLTN